MIYPRYSAFTCSLLILVLSAGNAISQNFMLGQDTSRRVITFAAPFLLISPDATGKAMGETGVARVSQSAPLHWNVAALSVQEQNSSISYSYTPWLSRIINDMDLHYLSLAHRFDSTHAIGGALRYFNLGNIFFPMSSSTFRPRELAIDLGYSYRITDNLSFGAAGRFIYSNLAGNFSTSTIQARISRGYSFDLGLLYSTKVYLFRNESELGLGILISNFGPGMAYSNEDNKDLLPTNLRIGTSFSSAINKNWTINLNLDLNKYLVPSPPVYSIDPNTGALVVDASGDPVIAAGKDPTRGLLGSTFGSFTDAPDGLSEELQEVMLSSGISMLFKHKLFIRAGYFFEHEMKGNRRYYTLGTGYTWNQVNLNFAYIIPTTINHALSTTFSLTFSLSV